APAPQVRASDHGRVPHGGRPRSRPARSNRAAARRPLLRGETAEPPHDERGWTSTPCAYAPTVPVHGLRPRTAESAHESSGVYLGAEHTQPFPRWSSQRVPSGRDPGRSQGRGGSLIGAVSQLRPFIAALGSYGRVSTIVRPRCGVADTTLLSPQNAAAAYSMVGVADGE